MVMSQASINGTIEAAVDTFRAASTIDSSRSPSHPGILWLKRQRILRWPTTMIELGTRPAAAAGKYPLKVEASCSR